ncbi:hypothetical protein [Porphyromonas canoris]|nr:hypothetical protein [Porphyromonas canoris]
MQGKRNSIHLLRIRWNDWAKEAEVQSLRAKTKKVASSEEPATRQDEK